MFPLIVHHLQYASHVEITHHTAVASGKYKFNVEVLFNLGSRRLFLIGQTKKTIGAGIIQIFS